MGTIYERQTAAQTKEEAIKLLTTIFVFNRVIFSSQCSEASVAETAHTGFKQSVLQLLLPADGLLTIEY